MAKTSDDDTSDTELPNGAPTPRASLAPRITPTEQVATTPSVPATASPVPATAAASGGATGLRDGALDSDPASGNRSGSRENPSVFRRHPLASGIVAGLVVVVVVSGLTAWGVGAAVTASLTNQAAPLAPASTSTPAPNAGAEQGGRLGAGRIAIRATIQNINDSSWTILTKRGKTVNIAITSSTKFGSRNTAETLGSFSVGDNVIVIATRADGNATAVRVASATAAGTSMSRSSGTGTNTSTTAPTPSP
jgi:hypothetical protein